MARSPRVSGLHSAESRRLIEGGATAKERLLLEAGIDEAPPDRAGRARTLLALGIAVGASTVASSATAAEVASKGAAVGYAKAILLGAVSAVVAVGAVELASRPDTTMGASASRRAAGSPHRKEAMVGSPDAALVESATPLPPPPGDLSPLPAQSAAQNGSRQTTAPPGKPAASARLIPTASVRAHAPTPSSASELVAQVAALDRARAALRAGRASECLVLLDEFARSYPRSSLAPEATVVEVKALLAVGQRAQATELVRARCRAGGRGAYTERLMALVGLSQC